jgi:hypothetical protein
LGEFILAEPSTFRFVLVVLEIDKIDKIDKATE